MPTLVSSENPKKMATCEGVRLDFSTFNTQPRRVQRSNNHWICCLANSSDMGFQSANRPDGRGG